MRRAAIGVDIGGTNVKLGIVDERGKVFLRDTFPTGSVRSRGRLLAKLTEHIGILRTEARHRGLRLAGVGVGAPGPIDVERGLVYFFPNIPGWKNTPLKSILEKKLRLPVRVDNDANAMALGESLFGAGRLPAGRQAERCIVALTLGTGIGGGIVFDGKLYHGSRFSAAEMGHMVVDPSGPRCACGNRGCIEAFVGNGYFVRGVRARLKGKRSVLKRWMKEGKELTPKLVQEAARQGDAFSKAQWRLTGDRLGTFLAGLANLLNPERFVIGGGIALGGEQVLAPVRASLKKKAFPIAGRFVKVVPAVLGNDAGLVGAAALVLFRLRRTRLRRAK
jgi:glucokinase